MYKKDSSIKITKKLPRGLKNYRKISCTQFHTLIKAITFYSQSTDNYIFQRF